MIKTSQNKAAALALGALLATSIGAVTSAQDGDETRTLEEIWTYDGSGYYAEYAGEAKRLASGHTLQGFGTDGAIHEINEDADMIWGVEWRNKLLGTATFIEDIYALNEGGW